MELHPNGSPLIVQGVDEAAWLIPNFNTSKTAEVGYTSAHVLESRWSSKNCSSLGFHVLAPLTDHGESGWVQFVLPAIARENLA